MKKLYSLLIAISLCAGARAQQVAPFKTGDRVVFVGNSITDGGHYHSYIWLYYMTHFPDRRITCYNAGIGGDVIGQIATRFDADVLAKKPTVLTLTWGMNDTGYFEWYQKDAQDFIDKRLQGSFATYATVVDKLKKRPDIRTILIGSSPYDETTKFTTKNIYPHKSEALEKVINYQKQSAKDNHWGFVDFYHPMDAINKHMQLTDSAFSLTPNDRIHPDNDGHLVMAYLFLKAQGLNNLPVADVSINAAGKKLVKAVNCSVLNLSSTAKSLSFNYLAKSLPYPLDTISRAWGNHMKQSDALKVVPFNDEFNQEVLTVKNLKKGSYHLLIDGEKMGTWEASAFDKGVNLAEITTTPQYQQAIQIRELNEERWDIERRLRNYMWMEYDFLKDKGMLYNDSNAAMDSVKKAAVKNIFVNGNKDNYSRARYKSVRDAWQKEIDVLINQIYAINKPTTHHIQIIATK
ncbi:SGNH/GDSL hydrolase family protein [Mucilaginibacter sp. AK015]|uniref:SGNH/GDSL hydrolase family protein n=1 Tax=Mucilaginibacter sp. AK015 TaxID=2723072 RepID=UPI00161CA01B|nr:SGNH/GDSL hydrolase family protein [Mucilaginibacter sp. AK015]MBB5394091.1 lysophospholipase L1-like esterase [Mucilaginibacter sp. AK015]